MNQVVGSAFAVRTIVTALIGLFAGLALLLVLAGNYGVVSYFVAQRKQELGIRMALGADRRRLVALVLGQGARPALAGIPVGLAAAIAAGRLTGSLLYRVSAMNPLYLVGVAALLFALVLVAAFGPARRATRVDPAAGAPGVVRASREGVGVA